MHVNVSSFTHISLAQSLQPFRGLSQFVQPFKQCYQELGRRE
jgi:hypothetical protein